MSTPPACIPLPQNPLWRFHPETLDVRHSRSGAVALTFTMNKRRLAKITSPTGTEILVEVPAALPPGLLPVPGYPEYGFSQAEGRVYRAHGGWATFIPRALVPHRKKACLDLYVWLIPSKGMGKKRQVSLARIAKAIAEEQGLDYAWLRRNLPEGGHSGPSRASDPEPTGAQHGASLIGADTTISERPRFLSNREVAHLRLPVVDGWYWWRASDESRSTRRYVTDGGKQAFTPEGHRSTPFDMGGEWGYRAHAPAHPEPCNMEPAPGNRATELVAGPEGHSALDPSFLPETTTSNLEDNPIPEPAYLPGAELDRIYDQVQQDPEPLPSPFDLYPEGDPRWTEGEPEPPANPENQIILPGPKPDIGQITQVVRAPDVPVVPAPAPVFQPRIF